MDEGWKYCKQCGARLAECAPMCPHCNTPCAVPPSQTPIYVGPEKAVAVVLLIFLGSIGVHRFYVGDTRIGLLYILLFVLTCGIATSIWAFIDFICMVAMDDQTWRQRYGRKQ